MMQKGSENPSAFLPMMPLPDSKVTVTKPESLMCEREMLSDIGPGQLERLKFWQTMGANRRAKSAVRKKLAEVACARALGDSSHTVGTA